MSHDDPEEHNSAWESETLENAYKGLGEDIQAMGAVGMRRLLFVWAAVFLVAFGMFNSWYQAQVNLQDIARHQEALELLTENQALMSESIRDLAQRQELLDAKFDRLAALFDKMEFEQLREKSEARGVDSQADERR